MSTREANRPTDIIELMARALFMANEAAMLEIACLEMSP